MRVRQKERAHTLEQLIDCSLRLCVVLCCVFEALGLRCFAFFSRLSRALLAINPLDSLSLDAATRRDLLSSISHVCSFCSLRAREMHTCESIKLAREEEEEDWPLSLC